MVHSGSLLALVINALALANALNILRKLFQREVGTANANNDLSKSNLWQFLLRERFVRQPSGCRTFFCVGEIADTSPDARIGSIVHITIHLPSRLHAALAAREREAVLRETLTPVPPRAERQILSGNHQIAGHFFWKEEIVEPWCGAAEPIFTLLFSAAPRDGRARQLA